MAYKRLNKASALAAMAVGLGLTFSAGYSLGRASIDPVLNPVVPSCGPRSSRKAPMSPVDRNAVPTGQRNAVLTPGAFESMNATHSNGTRLQGDCT